MNDSAFDTLPGTLDQVWTCLADGVTLRGAAAHQIVLASVGLSGGAEARTVVLRAADRGAARLEVFTDSESRKVAELAANPMASLLVWDAAAQFQIRMRVLVTLAAAESSLWQGLGDMSRSNYGVTPSPATPIAAPDAYERIPDPDRLRRILCDVEEIDTVLLASAPHRRAVFRREDGFAGSWLAP